MQRCSCTAGTSSSLQQPGNAALSGLAVARLAARVAGLEAQLAAAKAENAEAQAQVEASKQVRRVHGQ